MPAQLTLVDRSVRTAARRLVGQALLNNLAGWLALSTGSALAWFVVQPLLLEYPPVWLRWAVLGGLSVVGLGMAIWQTVRTAPTRRRAALEVDSRFDLRERVTTALELPPDERATPAGKALAADVEAKVKKLSVGDKFPVKPRWTALLAPAFAVLLAAVVLWWNPSLINFGGTATAGGNKKGGEQPATNPQALEAKKKEAEERKKLDDLKERENRAQALAEMDKELKDLNNKFDKDPYDDLPEKARERVAEVTKIEEKVEKFNKEREQELKNLAEKLGQLDKLNKDEDFDKKDDGGAKDLNDALAQGDLAKAKEEIDELQKKAEENELKPEEAEKLSKQLDKIEDELERLEREQEKKKEELEKEKEKAEKEGRKEDAEQLDRELEKLEQEQKDGEDVKELGDELQKASDALKNGDKEGQQEAAQALKRAGQKVQKMQGKEQDLNEGEQRLEQLRRERTKAAAAAQKGDKGQEGQNGEKGDELNKGKSGPNKGGIGAGEREINKDAATKHEEQRLRSIMDEKGQTKFGGLTEGKGFKKTTDKELGGAIKKAAQDAPGAADVQRLPRDAKESVAEYFKKLGGTENK